MFCYTSCTGKYGGQHKTNLNLKSKTSSHFPNFDAINAWQTGHNSWQGFFLGQELLLDFAAWIELTLNADNSLISVALEVTEHNTVTEHKSVDELWVN